MDIKYTIKVSIVRLATNEIIEFQMSIPTSITATSDALLYDNFHIIGQDYVLNYFRAEVDAYLKANNLIESDIEVDSYEIFSETTGVDVFFVNPEDSSEFTLSPQIKAYVHPKYSELPAPTLIGFAYDSTTVIWSWESDEEKDYAHYLLDAKDNVIAQLPIGVSHYTESSLNVDTEYTRKLVKYDANRTSKASGLVTVRTKAISDTNSKKLYEVLKKENYDKTPITVVKEHVEAFHSGIGDLNDLLISKQSDADFYEKFNILTKLYGVYQKNEKRYEQVGFNYRIRAHGTYQAQEQDGFCTMKFDAYPIEKVRFRIYKYASKAVPVNWRVRCTVEYYELDSEGDFYIPHQKNLTSPTFTYTIKNAVKYTSAGQAELVPCLGDAISSKTILQIMQDVGNADAQVSASAKPPVYSGFTIEDDYSFDIGDPSFRYKKSSPRTMSSGGNGSVKIYAKLAGNHFDPNSKVYYKGFAEAQLFEAVKFIDREMSYLDGSDHTLLSSSDLNIGSLKNIADTTYTFDGSTSAIHTIVEVPSCDEDLYLSTIDVTKSVVCSGTAPLNFHTPDLPYIFNSVDPYSNIQFNRVIEGLKQDIKKEYYFKCHILDVSDNVIYDASHPVVKGELYEYRTNPYTVIHFYTKLKTVTKEWTQTLPDPAKNDPLYGVVNGRFIPQNGYSGKQDLEAVMPTFLIPVYVQNITYHISIESISPADAFIAYHFEHEYETGVGKVNGDQVTFSSDSVTYKQMTYKDLIATERYEGYEVFDLKGKQIVLKVPKPEPTGIDYIKYEFEATSDNNDVWVTNCPNEIKFYQDPQDVTIRVKGQQNATSRWSPRAHNGYYYINQHEHFLFSEFDADADYKHSEAFKEEDIHYSINVDLSKPGGATAHYSIIKDEEYDLLKDRNSLFRWDKGYVKPAPYIDTKYYKEYKTVEYLTPVFMYPNIATVYHEATFNTVNPGASTVQIYVRAYEFDKGSWSNWMPTTSGQIPSIPYSAAVQFKAVFNAATTNVTKTILETDCCYQEYKDNADIKMSSNLYMSADVIKPANSSAEAIYVSKIFDFGTKVSFGVRGFNTDTDVLYYMAYSNNKADLETNPIWYSVDSSTVITGYRYYRYKIRIPRNEVVNLVYRTLTTPVTTEYVPGAGNFKLDVDYTPHDMEYSFTQNYTNKILFDGNWHIVLQSIKDAIEPQIQAAGFSLDDIVNIEIIPKSDNAELKYDAVTLPKNETAKMIDIFNSWTRFSHSGTAQPASASEMTAWEYNAVLDSVRTTVNSSTFIGFISDKLYDKYKHTVTFSSEDSDDDIIGTVIAFATDGSGKQHTLSLVFNAAGTNGGILTDGTASYYKVIYNLGQPNQKVIVDGNHLVNHPTTGWKGIPNGITAKVERYEDDITVSCSQYNSLTVDPSTAMTVNLSSDPVLAIFKGPKPYGYCSWSQYLSAYTNIRFLSINALEGSIQAKGKDLKIDFDKDTPYINFVNNTCVIYDLPLQFCPIIVQDDILGSFKEVNFRDDNGELTLTYNEKFISDNQKCFSIKYNDYDQTTLVVKVDEVAKVLNTDYTISNNIIEFKDRLPKGAVVEVSYMIINSFIALLDIENKTTTIKAHANSLIENARVMFETNERDNRKSVRHLSMNPIYNTDYKGFIYVSYDIFEPKAITIHANPVAVKADGKDGVTVNIILTDALGNPTPGEELTIETIIGTVDCKDFMTDANGVVTLRYTASHSTGVDEIKVKCKGHDLASSIKIKNV